MSAAQSEQKLLSRSIAVTLGVGATGIVFGILSGSQSIIFDGLFSAVDASMTALALVVARLIAREASPRFQMGFWHIEPMVLALNAGLITLLTVYALVNAVTAILSGGRELAFDWAIVYAIVVAATCFVMFVTTRRANRQIGSDFLALDAKGWAMSGLITSALLVAFVGAWLMQGTRFSHLTPYVDPVVLAVLVLAILPVPLGIFRKSLSEIFLVAPRDLDDDVRRIAQRIVEQHGFRDARTYVARVGRSRMIEFHFILAPDDSLGPVRVADAIRSDISQALGGPDEHRWLTVSFTGDPQWAD